MKRHAGIAAFIMTLATGFHTVGAQTISAGFEQNNIAVGSDAVLKIDITAKKMTGIQFDIIYDPAVLEYKDSQISTLFDNALAAGINNVNPGKINALAAFSEEQELSGNICEIRFLVIGTSGEKSVSVENIKLMLNGERVADKDFEISFKTKGRAKSNSSKSASGIKASIEQEQQAENTETQPTQPDKIPDFIDINGHWAEAQIRLMLNEGILNGTGNNSFEPDKTVTRAEFAVIVAGALNLENTAENIYTDLPEDKWFTDAALKCCAASVMVGDSGMFRPNDAVTREEMAVILSKACSYIGIGSEEKTNTVFTDMEDISEWAKIHVERMIDAGIISGYDDGSFRPHENTTRAHAVTVMSKLLENQWKKL